MIPVMIIEDEFLVRVGLKISIDWEECGYEIVAEAEDGEEAIQKFQQHRPRLVVTDIRLPKKDGLEVMREIKKMDSETRFIIVSAYDDFEVAREAITIGVEHYFLKGSIDSDEVEATLRNIREKNKWEDVKQYTNDKNVVEGAVEVDIGKYKEGVYVVCAKAKNADTEKIIAMLEIVYAEKNIFYRFIKKERQILYLIALKDYSIEEIIKITERVFRRYLSEKVYIGISRRKQEKTELEEKIWEAILACEYADMCNAGNCEFYKESEKAYEHVKPLVNNLEECFRHSTIGGSRKILEKIFREFAMHYGVKDFYRLLYKMIGILADVDAEMIEGDTFRDLIDYMSYWEIMESLAMWFEVYEEKIGSEKENYYVSLAKNFIRDNIKEPLNLGMLADAVHISPNYLGRVFKLHTGEYITDYITRVRLEKSREFLQDRKYTIGQVAELVGIPDSRYFSKLFKKHYGTTPKDYMKKD